MSALRCRDVIRALGAYVDDELSGAERRGVSFASLMATLLADKASELRRSWRPRFGLGQGGGGLAEASVDDEDAPAAGGS